MSDETTNDNTNDSTNDTAVATSDDTTTSSAAETEVETEVQARVEPRVEPKAEPKAAEKVVASDEATDDTRTNPRKVREGIVVSDKMDSTLVVAVNERVRHARYGKTVQRTKKLYVHDEKNEAKVGDKVRVQETRPLSKLKRWRLTEIVERAR